ncbi:rRNA pseudouridine synthase [Lacrimispora sp. NSJ-141]|uniref:Pseudouridine synthase n=1 Tax=Lientehia hominis TaxID=2897778 RepID=A0AAP2RIC0_9FIRM|nr:pseudouridine synthase [Lientehia hominis]MCD2491989.1 rRNA pseudouridine synthase [Lientehia hominis]
MKIMRLDKFLADSGLGTRSQVKLLIKKGLISINGETGGKPEQKIDAEQDRIFCQDKPVSSVCSFYYYMLNKPAGYVSATDDNTAPTVLSLLKDAPGKNLFPAGRLDKDTTGLLLITNDGPLAHRLLSPKNHVDKTYFVRVSGIVTSRELQLLEAGLDIGEESFTLPARARLISVLFPQESDGPVSEVELTIHEGKFHQVKRMFQAVGMPVLYLKRLSMGSLKLDASLAEGSYRPLTPEETAALKKE